MERRAGPLLANRSLSALIVVSFVLSAFAGLYIVASPPPLAAADGDLIVDGGTVTIENIEHYPVDGNVIVSSGGTLIVRNSGLEVISNVGSPRTVTVGAGGTLVLEHSVLTSYLDQIDPWPFLTVTIQDGGVVTASDSSAFRFPGSINIENAGILTLHDSSIDQIPDEDLVQYVSGSASVTMDSADDGPAIVVDDATLMMFDSSIESMPEFPADMMVAGNLTLSGDSTLLAVNSYIDVDFGPVEVASDWYSHNVLVLTGTSSAHLYGTHFEPFQGAYSARAPAIVANGQSYAALPTDKGPEDNTGQEVTDLAVSGDGYTYQIEPGETMAIDDFSAGPSATVDSATLYVRYAVSDDYDGSESITWKEEGVGSAASTGITPDASETSFVVKTFDLDAAGVTTTDDLATLDINFHHDGGEGVVQIDSMSILITIGPEAYIYRWVEIIVGDEYGVPIPDCEISAVFTESTAFTGQPAFYYSTDGVSSTPPVQVLEYMELDASSFGLTDSMGVARIPLLTDLISGIEYPNSLFVGSYELNGTVEQDGTTYSSTEEFSFPAYPAMTIDDQEFYTTVYVEHISAESPDSSRWLVVPPDLLIEDMEYYHAGDVIVASDGTLTLRNAVFRVVQEVSNEFTIYVDGTANFVIEDSELVSALPLTMIVKGDGTLDVKNSVLSGIDIEVMENAEVMLDGATVSGSITTSWDSEAHVVIRDSALAQSPVLSGETVCEVTNTSAPSIIVEDDAVALLYRWIHITVYDGGNFPLENAVVSARFYVNQTHWTSAPTDSKGVARLNSLGTILTSTGSTYVGQYRVNSSYWSDGMEYESDMEVNVSVLPYTEPLTENATFAILTMSTVLLPDLSILSTGIWTEPSEVVYNTTCTIVARVWNFGVAAATNTLVEFYIGTTIETGVLIGSYTMPIVSPGSYDEAYITWTPMTTGSRTLWVSVNDPPAFNERTFVNNNASIPLTVLGYANLEVTDVEFYQAGTGYPLESVAGGVTITVRAEMRNVGEATVTDVFVRLTAVCEDDEYIDDLFVPDVMRQNYLVVVQFSYTVPIVNHDTDIYFEIEADPDDLIKEPAGDDNNIASATLLALDVREDLKIAVEDIVIDYESDDNTSIFGDTVKIVATVYNLGGTDVDNATIEFGCTLWAAPIGTVNEAFPKGTSKAVSIDFRINITTGDTYDIYVLADSEYVYSEQNETNNRAEVPLIVEQLEVDIVITLGANKYQAEETLVLYVTIAYAGTNVTVQGLSGLSMTLMDENDDPVESSSQATTNANGMATLTITLDEDIASGDYTVLCTIEDLTETAELTVEIEGIVSGGDIPLMVWIIVIAVIAALVIGFTAYTYMYGVGKLVECGECGEFIPASNKRCPKCGVEFEVGTMKCSECGAWVPAESAECPNCGVKFVGEETEEGDYLEKMRAQYDEMVSKYRELAKAQLGRKYSDKKFEEWWVAQPTYISFDDWLAKEEEKRKEGPVSCPVCGTLNPREATVCNRCGTVFGPAEEELEQEGSPPYPPVSGQEPARQQPMQPAQQQAEQTPQQQAAPKMVIRRPIDRKVVPKKVIRTPISRDESGDEGSEGQ